jgi:hypothetical protein
LLLFCGFAKKGGGAMEKIFATFFQNFFCHFFKIFLPFFQIFPISMKFQKNFFTRIPDFSIGKIASILNTLMVSFKDFYYSFDKDHNNISESLSFKEKMLMRREEVKIDKENAPVVFQTERGSEYRIGESGTVYRQKYSGSNFTSDSISFVDENTYRKIIKLPSKYEDSVIMVKHHASKIDFMIDDEIIASFPSLSFPEIGLYPVDSKNGYVHVGHRIHHINHH